jgi:tetratricopeptide (TPR) repeat protein
MRAAARLLKCAVAALWLGALPALATDGPSRASELLAQLQDPEVENWRRIERQLWNEWSKSGSPAMDLLLQRGRDALARGETEAAIEHLTALTDHAPDFAEGWNVRATAFFQAGLYGPSVEDIGRTLTLNPDHFGALSGLATILEQTGRYETALETYRAALAIHPHQPGVIEAIERLGRKLEGQDI